MSILSNWYHGNTCLAEKIGPQNKKYRSLAETVSKERQYFLTRLSMEDKERFEKWNDLLCEMEHMTEYENFVYGFRLGARLIVEIFETEDTDF